MVVDHYEGGRFVKLDEKQSQGSENMNLNQEWEEKTLTACQSQICAYPGQWVGQ